MTIARQLIGDFENEAEASKKLLEAVPEDHFGYKPHEKSWDMATLAGHVAESPSWAHSMMETEMNFEDMPKDWKPFVPETKAQLMETFERYRTAFVELMADRDDAFMEEVWTMRAGDKVMMQMPRHAALRSMMVHHIIHHRAQLGVYLPND